MQDNGTIIRVYPPRNSDDALYKIEEQCIEDSELGQRYHRPNATPRAQSRDAFSLQEIGAIKERLSPQLRKALDIKTTPSSTDAGVVYFTVNSQALNKALYAQERETYLDGFPL
jgi:hypothetical protein